MLHTKQHEIKLSTRDKTIKRRSKYELCEAIALCCFKANFLYVERVHCKITISSMVIHEPVT